MARRVASFSGKELSTVIGRTEEGELRKKDEKKKRSKYERDREKELI